MINYSIPTHWDDNLDWSINAYPTVRHIQAIYQAIHERKFFNKDPHINLAYSKYHTALTERLVCSASHLQELSNRIYLDIMSLVNINEQDSVTCGSLGDGFVNFCFSGKPRHLFDTNQANIHSYTMWENLDLSYFEDEFSGRFIRQISSRPQVIVDPIAELKDKRFNELNTFIDITKGEDILLSARKFMNFLRRCKSFISSLNSIECASFVAGGGDNGGFSAYYGHGVLDGLRPNEGFTETSRVVHSTKPLNYDFVKTAFNPNIYFMKDYNCTPLYIVESYSKHVEIGEGMDSDYRQNEYAFIANCPPIKYKHLCQIPAQLHVHIWEDFEVNGVKLDKFQRFNTPFYHRGWNDLGVINYGDEVELTTISASNESFIPFYPDCWHECKNEDFDAHISFGIDGIKLNFYESDGFAF